MLEMDSSASGNLEVTVIRAEVINWLNSSDVVVSMSFVPRRRRIFLAFGISIFRWILNSF